MKSERMTEKQLPILSVRNISLKYNNSSTLRDVNLDIFGNEVHALVGNHDEGKTWFCKVLCGEVEITNGLFLDIGQHKLSRNHLREVIEVVWEDPSVFDKLCIAENIVIGTSYAKWHIMYRKKTLIRKIQTWFDRLGLDWDAGSLAGSLSASDQIFLSLLRAVYRDPDILVLDSALASLPPETSTKVHKILRGYLNSRKGVLWVTHDLDNISKFADRVSIFRDGHILLSEKIGEIERLNLLELCYARLDNMYSQEQQKFHEMLFYFDALLEQLPLSVFILNNSGEIVFANHQAKELFGETIDISTISSLPHTESDISDIMSIIKNTESFENKTSIPVKINGTSHRMKVGVHKVLDKEIIAGKMIIVEDVTVTENLREQITLAENLSSLSLLSAGVSHEINNSLNIIATYIAFLSGNYSKDQQGEAIENIRDEVKEIKRITSNLKVFSGNNHTITEVFDCIDIINNIVSILRFEARHNSIQLKTEISDDILNIRGNPGEIRQVLLNLVRNSFESILSVFDTGVITIRTQTQENNSIIISVEDTGTGIEHDRLNDIFLPFYSTKNGRYDNQGLGLSIVYGIVKRHNGNMTVTNISPHGCKVSVLLPALTD